MLLLAWSNRTQHVLIYIQEDSNFMHLNLTFHYILDFPVIFQHVAAGSCLVRLGRKLALVLLLQFIPIAEFIPTAGMHCTVQHTWHKPLGLMDERWRNTHIVVVLTWNILYATQWCNTSCAHSIFSGSCHRLHDSRTSHWKNKCANASSYQADFVYLST